MSAGADSEAGRDAGRAGLVYLLTGGSGFVGRRLARMLAEREPDLKELRVLDITLDPELHSLNSDALCVRVIQGDVTDMKSVREAARGVDLIIHTAGLIDVCSKYPPKKLWAVNYQGTLNVVNACRELGIRYLVHTSSMEALGPNKHGSHFVRGNEDTEYEVSCVGPYAESKMEAEKLVLSSNGSQTKGGGRLATCALRPTGVYGEGNPIMEDLYRTVMRFGGKRLRLAGKDIEHGRVYVGNVAWMHLLAARALRQNPGLVGGEAYFCYDESPYLSYEDFDQLLLGSAGVRLVGREPVLPFGLLYLLALTLETLQWILRPIAKFEATFNRCTLTIVTTAFSVSTNKAARHLGYSTLVPWHQCQARTVAWVKSLAQTGSGRGPAI
ncbi:3 beta-hydroxysteroid dehydrogenase type 7-like [Amblyraja radiata]|uniref:3 beta-hydroxysteroid dehydrogenase type 7-like n=1 Tax=Amblyraja radiata TaxID=386614 RepID=UPI0014030A05|nr:3 beta-hydroxysteroid dehydrogenase type 7-like [Amblyraja radiata]